MADDAARGSRASGLADADAEPESAPRTSADGDLTLAGTDERTAEQPAAETASEPAGSEPAGSKAAGSKAAGRRRPDGPTPDDGPRRAVLPVVPVLAALLVLLLAGTGYLWFTRPGTSAVRTADYVDALQAARAGIVDVASFDYLTLDDDIAQIEAVTTGDLRTDSVEQLDGRRQDIVGSQAVVNTEVVGAAVGAADDTTATVFMVIQSTQTSSASEQAQVQRYRIEVDLTKDGDRWLLSGIAGR